MKKGMDVPAGDGSPKGGGMRYIPIHLAPIEIQIPAARSLVFRFITTFGTANSGSEMASRVISRENDSLLVEFNTSLSVLPGVRRVVRTVERVTLHEPELVEFEEVEGPLAMRRERLVLEEGGGETCLRYEADLGVRGWVPGWLLGVLFVRPKLRRAVREHMEQIREDIEASRHRNDSEEARGNDSEAGH